MILEVDPKYYRPAEVETLLGDPTKAREKLCWIPRTQLKDMVAEMVAFDLEQAKQDTILRQHGFSNPLQLER